CYEIYRPCATRPPRNSQFSATGNENQADKNGAAMVTTSAMDGYVLCSVKEDLDIASSPKLAAKLAELDGVAPFIVLDLSQCQYIDSFSLSHIYRYVRERSEVGIVLPESGNVPRILSLANVLCRLPVAATVEDAVNR